jgi:hypothetical protein
MASAQVPPQRLAPEGASPPIAVTPPTNSVAPPIPPPEQQPPATPSEQKPGWFDTLGHWFDESVTNVNKGWDNMNKGLKSTLGAVGGQATDTTKSAAEAASNMAKGAADAVGRLGTSRLVSGQALCALAPNGAPDCRGAAESLCKTAGFTSGSSVDYVTSEKCPSEAYLAGRHPAPGECKTEHTVTRALCQ